MEIVQSLLTKMGIFHKPQIKALTTLFATILIACGKVNFTNLSRYSQRTERSYRRQFKKQFDFAQFNAEVIKAATPENHSMIREYLVYQVVEQHWFSFKSRYHYSYSPYSITNPLIPFHEKPDTNKACKIKSQPTIDLT